MKGIQFTAESLRKAYTELQDFLGSDWVAKSNRLAADSAFDSASHEEHQLRTGLCHLHLTVEASDTRVCLDSTRLDSQLVLRMCMIARIVQSVREMKGGSSLLREMRRHAQNDRFDQFFNFLFEAEAAVFWSEQMQARVEFDERSDHPDFWAYYLLGGSTLQSPVECKRIAPVGWNQNLSKQLSEDLHARLTEIARSRRLPLKAVLWLHAHPDEVDSSIVAEYFARLADDLDDASWVSASAVDGSFQLSIARLAENYEFRLAPLDTKDVPAAGPLIMKSDGRKSKTGRDLVRPVSVLQLRTDVLPKRLGSFEGNLRKAVEKQLPLRCFRGLAGPGAVAIRLKPPRGLGDLFEADSIVRRVLSEREPAHVSLVALFWDESEREEGKKLAAGERRVRQAHHFRPYFISNPGSPLDFSSIDSRRSIFGEDQRFLIRNPETGELTPLPEEICTEIRHAEEAKGDGEDYEATVYLQLGKPLQITEIGRQEFHFLKTVRIHDRAFAIVVDRQFHARLLEFEITAEPVLMRIATIDLRAWAGQTELLFYIIGDKDQLFFEAPLEPENHEGERVVARSVRVRPYPGEVSVRP